MQIGAVGVQPARTLGAVFTIVAVTHNDHAERFHVLAEVGATAVVLEADDLARLAGLGCPHPNQHVSDHALLVSLPGLRVQVEDAHARKLLALGRLVGVAHELVATAHPEYHAAVLHNGSQVRALGAREVFGQHRLFPVLANVDDLHPNAAPLATLLDGDDVSPVAVKVHHVRVQVVDGQLDPPHGITPFVASPAVPTAISRVPSAWTAARSPSIA